MGKDKEGSKKPSFKEFLKKRAPIYLGLIGLFIIFVVPELTQSNLEKFIPQDFTKEQQTAFDLLMSYNGPNHKGLTVLEAIKQKINDDYTDEKIYEKKGTNISFDVIPGNEQNIYKISLLFNTYKESKEFVWSVDVDSNNITADSLEAKYILDLVNYYD